MKLIFTLRQLPDLGDSSLAERLKIMRIIRNEILHGWRRPIIIAVVGAFGYASIRTLHLYIKIPLVSLVFGLMLILLAHLIELNLYVRYAQRMKPEILQARRLP